MAYPGCPRRPGRPRLPRVLVTREFRDAVKRSPYSQRQIGMASGFGGQPQFNYALHHFVADTPVFRARLDAAARFVGYEGPLIVQITEPWPLGSVESITPAVSARFGWGV